MVDAPICWRIDRSSGLRHFVGAYEISWIKRRPSAALAVAGEFASPVRSRFLLEGDRRRILVANLIHWCRYALSV